MRLEIELRCILFPLITLEMFLQLDWSPPPVVNWIDWTWFGKAHICLYKRSHSWQCMSEQKQRHEAEGIVRRAPRQACAEAQIWGRVPKYFCIIEGPQEHCGLIILKMEEDWNHQDRPTWAIGGEGPWSGRWPRTRWSLWQSSRVFLWRWDNLPEGQPSLHLLLSMVVASCCEDVFQRKGTKFFIFNKLAKMSKNVFFLLCHYGGIVCRLLRCS